MLHLHRSKLAHVALITLVLLGLSAGAAHAQPPFTPPYYCVTDLGAINGSPALGFDLNNQTQAVGNFEQSLTIDRVFFWENGNLLDLGQLSFGSSSRAEKINETGIVVGTGRDSNGWNQAIARYYGSGSWLELPHPGQWSEGWSVNNRIQYVGTYYTPGFPFDDPHPFVYHPRIGTIDLGTFDGAGLGQAFAINERAQIGGFSHDTVGECGLPDARTPVLWEPTTYGYTDWSLTVLPTNGPCHARVLALNELDVLVGIIEGPLFPTPVVWRKGHSWIIRKLEAGELELGAALDVNESGLIVGFTDKATMWTITENRFDLNDYTFDSSWDLLSAQAINDSNEVVGIGRHNGEISGFLLTPRPSPFTPCP